MMGECMSHSYYCEKENKNNSPDLTNVLKVLLQAKTASPLCKD